MTFESHAQRKKKGVEINLKEELTPYERSNAEYLMIEAQKFFLLEDYKRSLAFLDQSLEVDPENHAAHFKKAEVHLVLGEHTKGLTAIDKAITLKQDNKYYYVLAAQLQKASKNLQGAADYYDLMLDNASNTSSYLLEVTDVYEELKNFKKAIDVLDNAESTTPGLTLDQKLRKADLLIKSNQTKKVSSYLASLYETYPNNSLVLYQYASLLSKKENPEMAIQILEKSSLGTNDLKLLLAENYQKAGQQDKQKQLLLEIYSDDEANLSIKTLLLGQWAFSQEVINNVELIDSLQLQLETDYPNEALVIQNGGFLFTKLAQSTSGSTKAGFESKAIARYKQLARLKPGDFEVWKKVLTYEYQQKKWTELASDAEEALDLFPNQAVFYIYLASANQGLDEYDEAESLLKQALRMSFSNELLKSQILGKQAQLAAARDNQPQALSLFEEAIKISTPHPESVAAYADFLATSNPEKAIQLVDPVIASSFKNLDFIRIKASALFNLANYSEALELINQGMSEFPNQINGSVLEISGDLLFKMGLIEDAVKQWEEAKKLGNTSEKIDQKIENKQYN